MKKTEVDLDQSEACLVQSGGQDGWGGSVYQA